MSRNRKFEEDWHACPACNREFCRLIRATAHEPLSAYFEICEECKTTGRTISQRAPRAPRQDDEDTTEESELPKLLNQVLQDKFEVREI
jgi:hypothetical protein